VIGAPPTLPPAAALEPSSPMPIPATDPVMPLDVLQSLFTTAFGFALGGWRWLIVASIVVALLVGYLAGRAHARFAARSAAARAGEEFADGLRLAFSPDQVAANVKSAATLEQSLNNPIDLGVSFVSPSMRITVIDALIRVVDVDAIGGQAISKDPHLMISLLLQNADERKELNFRGSGAFQLRDDRGQPLRRVEFEFPSSRIVGALGAGVALAPRSTVSHLEIFEVPARQAQFVILTVDLAGFGEPRFLRHESNRHEFVSFKIPVEKIKGFKTHPRPITDFL